MTKKTITVEQIGSPIRRPNVQRQTLIGLGLIVLGLLPQVGSIAGGLKLVCVWLLAQLSAATASQLIAGALHRRKSGR